MPVYWFAHTNYVAKLSKYSLEKSRVQFYLPRASSSWTVLPIMTPYSPEGRHFSKSVRDYWHIIENNPRLHSIWPNCPFTSHRKKKISQGHLFVISIQSYPSQHHLLTGTPFDKGNLVCGMSASPNLKPTYRSLLSHTSWSSISYPPYTHTNTHTRTHTHTYTHSFHVTNIGHPKPRGLGYKQSIYETTFLHFRAKISECTKPGADT